MIALVIFSKGYASSRWCLQELVKIMEHKEANQQIVIPVFYLVDPSDVRHQKGTYAEAFTLHEDKFKDKVEIWRSVLEISADLSGYDSSKFQNESKLIDAIVQDVSKKLQDNSPIVPKSLLIGFNQNFTSVESLMEMDSQEARIVGIWGMGGIGKTSLACAIFDKFLPKFESHCFLPNVREKSAEIDGLNSLREKLLSKILGLKDHQNMNDDAMRGLQRKKVLIVLDDVNDSKQLKDLAGCLHLGLGSRVIVTSRDKQVLRSGGILEIYIHEVIALNLEKSLELFSIHAFNQSYPKMGYVQLSQMTVTIAKGIPLALEVLGSHFHSRDKAYWESELSKLKKYPHQQIHNILKISYDGLDDMDKEIFLDIAFFYVRQHKDQITSELKACGFEATSGIQNLIDKALIKSDEYGTIVMHDLIQEMAEQIVRKKCNPEARSRLKDADEICAILGSNMGTGEIEGIIMKHSQRRYPPLRADFFIKMKNLRILKILAKVKLQFGLEPFPDKIRYLHWNHYPLESLPSGSWFENLVELHMQHGNFKKLWDGRKDLANLKKINLCYSKQLMELPDLSMAQRLEIVNLSGCRNLRSVHPSILSLHTIIKIDVFFCKKLESLESETHLESLSYLEVGGCDSLKRFCLSSKKLRCIDFRSSGVEILHFPNGCFPELRELQIDGGRLRSLPISELCGLTNLKVFGLYNFEKVISLMEINLLFDAWPNLIELYLDGSAIETLPACVTKLSSLRSISLRGCKRLKSIFGLPPFIQELDAIYCTSLITLSSTSLPFNKCRFEFYNCVMLDESSLCFIEQLTHSSLTLVHNEDLKYDCRLVCYPGSRVPKWMKDKKMTYASNVIDFTFNFERSLTLVLCCVAPRDLITSESGALVFCDISCDDNHEFSSTYDYKWVALNSDHVFLWQEKGQRILNDIGTINDVKIKCEFFVSYYHGEELDEIVVPAKTCGVHLIYH